MRVVGSQPAARLAQEERVQAADRDARDQRDRQDRANRRGHSWPPARPDQGARRDRGERKRSELKRREQLDVCDRPSEVGSQLREVVRARGENPRRQRDEESSAGPVAAHVREQRCRDRSADAQHDGKSGEQGEAEQRRRRPARRIDPHLRARMRERAAPQRATPA